jgi:hypothetical protein
MFHPPLACLVVDHALSSKGHPAVLLRLRE